jgi:probable F420-dependent oxidoreductase
MKIGVIFPQIEIGHDPMVIRAYAQAAKDLGYSHILAYDHVLGADPARRPNWTGYTHTEQFHEPFVLFGFIAAAAPGIELITGVIILPQRQTALVAKQAAEVDVLTGGNFRLGIGVGWNAVEYEALNENFRNRGRRSEEQIELLRALWSDPVVSFSGTYHRVAEAGLNPMPIQQPIPIWLGGDSDVAMERAGRLADGWLPHGRPDDLFASRIARLQEIAAASGRPANAVGIEGRLSINEVPESQWGDELQRWRAINITHLGLNTMGAGLNSPDRHIEALQRFAAIAFGS